MQYKLGNSKKVYDKGETTLLECPNCKKKVKFEMFSNFDTRLKASFPLIESKNVYFVVCPNCAKVYGVEHDSAKEMKKDKLAVGNFDITDLKPFDIE